jgi:uncharacterized phage protein (TIGR02218 family)
MTTYLTRPVFEFDAVWQAAPRTALGYDLRTSTPGFGKLAADQEQLHVTESWQGTLALWDAAAWKSWEEFLATVKGRLKGFWLPSWDRAMEIVEVISGTTFDITDIGLTELFAELPQLHLQFIRSGAVVRAQVNSVTDIGNGRERVVLTGSVSITTAHAVNRLIYVRLQRDELSYRFTSPNIGEVGLQVVELPTEYATAETGLEKVTLFHFWIDYPGVTQHYRFTSFQENIVSNGNTFLAMPIDYSGIKHDLRASSEQVEITCAFDDNPLARFFPFGDSRPMQCEILEANYATPNTTTAIAGGYVVKPTRRGRETRASLVSFADFLRSKLPALVIQPRCPLQWGDPRTCKVDPAAHAVTFDIQTITGNVILLDGGSGTYAEGRFAGGYLKVGTGANLEVRDIMASADSGVDLQLTLNFQLFNAEEGDTVTIYPGCQRTLEDCETTFNNRPNFRGCLSVPSTNMSVPQRNVDTNGNKK